MLKRTLSLALLLVLLVAPVALALEGASFTHPEIGEFLTIKYAGGMPRFTIYDFPYYELVDSAVEHRGMHANSLPLVHRKMVGLDESLALFFDSLNSGSADASADEMVYMGLNEAYSYALDALEGKERIRAIRLLNGFDGVKGFAKLRTIPGFEDADIDSLEAEYLEYTVKIGKNVYPYRVVAFHFLGDNWVEYTERYNYLKVSGKWMLARIAVEYTADYQSRGNYAHGVPGSLPDDIAPAVVELMRGTQWGMTAEDVALLEGVQAVEGVVSAKGVQLFRIPAEAAYNFGKKGLQGMVYQLESTQAFYSSFISLYTRFSDPISIEENGTMTWSLNDLLITLAFNEGLPTVSLQPY